MSTTCPCCDADSGPCEPGCTFEKDCPEEHFGMIRERLVREEKAK